MERRPIYYSFITQTIPLSDQSVIISGTSVGFNAYLKSIIQHAYIQWHFIQECWHKLSISKLDMNHNCHFLYSITHYIYVFFWCMLLYFNFFQLSNVGFSLSYILLFNFKISPCLEEIFPPFWGYFFMILLLNFYKSETNIFWVLVMSSDMLLL